MTNMIGKGVTPLLAALLLSACAAPEFKQPAIAVPAGFKEAAPKFGLEIVSEYNYGMSDRQFGSIVASVKRDNPDVIYASGYFFTAGPLVSQLRAGGVTATIVGQEGYDTPNFIDIAKAAAEGVIITTSLDRDSKDPEMRARFKELPTCLGQRSTWERSHEQSAA